MDNKITGEFRDIVENTKCSEDQWKAFFSSSPWQEFVDTMHIRLALTRDDLEQQEGIEAAQSQGDARTIRFVLNLQEIITSEFKALADEKEPTDG